MTFAQLVGEGRLRPLANSQAVVDRMMGERRAFIPLYAGYRYELGAQFYHPIYFSRPSDPLFTVTCTEQWGRCEVEGAQVRIPAQARPDCCVDKHMTVIDQQTGWEYDFWGVEKTGAVGSSGGTLRVRWGGMTRIDGDGLGSNATAAHFALSAGIIRAQELVAGRIEHGLFFGIDCSNGTYTWPAHGPGTGTPCSTAERRAASAPLGAYIHLDMTPQQIDQLPVPAWKKPILKAMAKYGMWIGDTNGEGNGSGMLQFESGNTYTAFGHPDPIYQFAQQNRNQGGITYSPTEDAYYFDIQTGVDWRRYLRVYTVQPPSS